jgi:hypothetical protein
MPSYDPTIRAKIADLQTLRKSGVGIEVYELIHIAWTQPLPGETATDRYYSVLPLGEAASVAPPVSPIDVRLIPESYPDYFVPLALDSAIGDEEMTLSFWDADGKFSDLIELNGEGVPVELLYWFPQVTLLLPIWLGHLKLEDDAEVDRVKIKAVNGFRSSDATLPHRQHWRECSAIFGGSLPTQAEINRFFDCKYNRHVGGSNGNLNGGVPYTFCPRRTRQDCIDRLGEGGNNMLSHATIASTVVNNQTKGNRLLSTSSGNETALTEPVRVIMGKRRVYGMPVLVFRRDLNNNNPDRGFFVAEYECCEGPIQSISAARVSVGNDEQPVDLSRYAHRLGTRGQGPVDISLTVHGYSGTAHFRYYYGWVNPAEVNPSDAKASALIEGLNNIRIYTNPTTYTEGWTSNRVWQIMRMMCDTRWGYGLDYSRFDIQSWIDAATWAEQWVQFTDFSGQAWVHRRSDSHVELIERKAQQQIEDMCLAGRLSRPFIFNGKIHIVPLREATTDEIVNAPFFTDEGDGRNILWEEIDGAERSTLRYSRKSDLDLINRVEVTFDDITQDYTNQPAPPVEDIDAQLRAGRVAGDFTRKQNPKKYNLLGVVNQGQAIKIATALLDLGEFDEGGLQNNLRIKFKIWFADALELHPAKIIRVLSSRLERFSFEYFRVVSIERQSDLTVEIEAQAYNPNYMASFETTTSPPTNPPSPPPPDDEPCRLTFGNVTYQNGTMLIPIPPC